MTSSNILSKYYESRIAHHWWSFDFPARLSSPELFQPMPCIDTTTLVSKTIYVVLIQELDFRPTNDSKQCSVDKLRLSRRRWSMAISSKKYHLVSWMICIKVQSKYYGTRIKHDRLSPRPRKWLASLERLQPMSCWNTTQCHCTSSMIFQSSK